MSMPISRVLEFGCPEPQETVDEMHRKLRYHTDSWDLAQDLTARPQISSSWTCGQPLPTKALTYRAP